MTRTGHRPAVRAAGGVVIRGDTIATAEVALVHRPRYDDWSLPKGKHDPGENSSACSLREVEEETGLRCRIVAPAGTTSYRVGRGPKQVDYFLMRPFRNGGFRPDNEVDEMRWTGLEAAASLLTYDFDRELIEGLDLPRGLSHTTLHVVRHAAAGDRSRWPGPDRERPLTSKGLSQSKALADELGEIGIARILTSPYERCVQTIAPLAENTGGRIDVKEALAEGAGPDDLERVLETTAGSTAVLCSHGDVIPALLDLLQSRGVRFLSPYLYRKGSTWVVSHDGTAFTEARYLPAPPV